MILVWYETVYGRGFLESCFELDVAVQTGLNALVSMDR